ncbi:MAG: ATP-binding protein, partial [Patescibacteria group bacterium]|nr:ATP-binding protein [Patescibacteria group bacterium]
KNIQFCVSDSGMGIGKEDLPNLFKKFSRGSGTSTIHTEGTGLGLYVAREMVEAHKGKIWAESKGKGKGSKFCFEIPIKS